jgi:hypothetical protein
LRWKLLIATSLVAALVGAGGSYGLIYGYIRISNHIPSTLTLVILGEAIPLAASLSAGVFVYRHTARRRKLQALLAFLLSISLAQIFIRFIMSFMPYFKSDD